MAEFFLWGFAGLVFFILVTALKEHDEKKRLELEAVERKTKLAEKQARLEAELWEWAKDLHQNGWSHVSVGKMMHLEGQPRCVLALAENSPTLRFDRVDGSDDFKVHPPIILSLSDIISLNVARPTVRKSREELTPVPITESVQRSPVARGLLGGAILGPAGLVLGAASGLNSKTTTNIEYQTVTKEYDAPGAPQLIIGTKWEDYPYFKIKCANQEVADEWMFRIRGRQAKMKS